jgi:hypothetical protein
MDLFDELFNHFKPHFEKIENLHDELVADIKRRIKRELMEATTIEAVDEIKVSNSVYIEMWPELLADFESASNRIRGIFKVQVDAWGLTKLN